MADALPVAIDSGQNGVALGAAFVFVVTDGNQRETVHAFRLAANVINRNVEVASHRNLGAGRPWLRLTGVAHRADVEPAPEELGEHEQ